MTNVTEINVSFTIPNVRDLDDATNQANARLTDLGITEEEYSYTMVVSISDTELLMADGGDVVKVTWQADVAVKGRVR